MLWEEARVHPLGRPLDCCSPNSVGLLEPHCWHLPTLGARVLLRFAVDKELLALLCLGQVPQGVSVLTPLSRWSLLKEQRKTAKKEGSPHLPGPWLSTLQYILNFSHI